MESSDHRPVPVRFPVGAAGSTVLDRKQDDEGDVDVIGEAKLALDSDDLGANQTVKLALEVEKPVARKVVRRSGPRGRGRRTKRVKETVAIPRGPNGYVEFVLTRLDEPAEREGGD